MKRLITTILLAAALAGLARTATAFSLLGPFKAWQVRAIGYDLPGDIGGPMTASEGYRWNVPTIYYAFDQSFVVYFGSNGMAAVDQAMKIFNDLPRFDRITNDESALYINGEVVPTDSRGPQNFGFNIAGVRDVKSRAMEMVIEELGLAEPTRYTWTLRARNTETIGGVMITNYTVIKLNYDPITYQTTQARVNGVLYAYDVEEPIPPQPEYADAVERAIDFTNPYGPAVADQFIAPGEYYFGLTHDDVGGLRFLYNKNNLATEQLLATVTGGLAFRGGSPWVALAGLTNAPASTNIIANPNALGTNLVITGIRPGLNKINFRRVNFDSLIGQFIHPVTNFYTDLVITNARTIMQPVQRVLTQPDILFTAEDLGLVANLVPVLNMRSDTSLWQNNDPLNGNAPQGGPGVIVPQITISFSDQLPYFSNTSSGEFLSGDDSSFNSAVWGSFDENSETPIIYPAYLGLTLQDIQRLVRQSGP